MSLFDIKIRFNTKYQGDGDLPWRVVINGKEQLASNVIINTISITTKDHIEGIGDKYHITCKADRVYWEKDECIIF